MQAAAPVRYIGLMFEVLVFVYENYFQGDALPEQLQLERKLKAVGFDPREVRDALTWLSGLDAATHAASPPQPGPNPLPGTGPRSLRAYGVAEQNHLGAECLGFLSWLDNAGFLSASLREIVLDRAMAVSGDPVLDLDDLKIIILMVFWSVGTEPDALLLDELCDDSAGRVAH